MVAATQESSVDGILKLLQGFTGSNSNSTRTDTTTPSTQTQQTSLSQDTLNGLLKSAMESNQGLASVAVAQNSAGMYNSTTNTMLTNDLLARMTTDVAAKSAPTVTTKTGGQTTSTQVSTTPGLLGTGGSPASSLGALALTSLAKGPIDRLMKGKNPFGDSAAASYRDEDLGNITSQLDTEIAASGGGSSAAADMATAVQDVPDYLGNWMAENNIGADVASNVASNVADNVVNDIGDGFSDAGSNIASDASDAGDWFSGAVDSVKDWFSGW
jgi:hypothetical protein